MTAPSTVPPLALQLRAIATRAPMLDRPAIAAAADAVEQITALRGELDVLRANQLGPVPKGPLQELGRWLSTMLDEDRWPTAERYLNAALADDAGKQALVGSTIAEFHRATAKFPTWPTDALHAIAVLGEEFGELTKAVLQLTYEPHKSSPDDVRVEAIQTAAMALRFSASLDHYQYSRCEQHAQPTTHQLKDAP